MQRPALLVASMVALLFAGSAREPLIAQPLPARPHRALLPEPPRREGEALFLASAVLPGTAQYLTGDDRWAAYVAAEVWALVSYLHQRRSARSLETRYRDLAWAVARRTSEGVRRDTVFEYYEALAHHSASGAFDLDPGLAGVQPERQLGTFNGNLWALARALHGGEAVQQGTPQYQRALDYYVMRAIPPGYSWAWGASHLEQQLYRELIRESDEAFRSAARYLGLLLANHLTSAVDALITARLRELGMESLRMESAPAGAPAGTRWEYGVRIRF